jgi:hypothetical protein
MTIELPTQEEQTAFNLRRWAELLADPEVAKIEGRIETDRHGHVIMYPPAAFSHGSYQSAIAYLLRRRFVSRFFHRIIRALNWPRKRRSISPPEPTRCGFAIGTAGWRFTSAQIPMGKLRRSYVRGFRVRWNSEL